MAAVLSRIQREFIVKLLAGFMLPRDILPLFQAKFTGTACSEQDILKNDPRVSILDPGLQGIYDAELERVLADPKSALYASQKARLISLSRQAERYERNNQPTEVRAVLRQIAEECGAIGAGKTPQQSASEAPKVDRIIHEIVDSADE